MARTKKQDAIITAAIIAGIFGTIAAYYQGPLADTQWKERPIIDISFGDLGKSYPKTQLQNDGTFYYLDILVRNRGQSDGKILVTIQGTGAKVNFDKSSNFDYQKVLPYTIRKLENYSTVYPPVYIQPDENISTFTIEMFAVDNTPKPINQELNPFIPTRLTYKKIDSTFELIDQNLLNK